MKTEHQYTVEFKVNGTPHRSAFVLPEHIEPKVSRRNLVVKEAITNYWKKITKSGTKIEITSLVCNGRVTMIESTDLE